MDLHIYFLLTLNLDVQGCRTLGDWMVGPVCNVGMLYWILASIITRVLANLFPLSQWKRSQHKPRSCKKSASCYLS